MDVTVHELDVLNGQLHELHKATGGPHGSCGIYTLRDGPSHVGLMWSEFSGPNISIPQCSKCQGLGRLNVNSLSRQCRLVKLADLSQISPASQPPAC